MIKGFIDTLITRYGLRSIVYRKYMKKVYKIKLNLKRGSKKLLETF